MKTILLSLVMLMLLTAPAPAPATTYPWLPHHNFSRILGDVVADGRVDYRKVRGKHWRALNDYLEDFAHDDFADYPRSQRLASYLNLYNATVIRAVAERYRPGYSVAEDDFKLFKEPLVRVHGKTMSLDELEKEVILPAFNDPRVHVGLVCAAESCPPILPRAYLADDVEALLEANMTRFVNDPARNPIDVQNRKLVVSKIFDWYADDFGGKDKIDEYIDHYHDADTTGWPVSFVEYSWKLNDAGTAE